MEDADLADDNLLSDKMKINLHMLGALMLNGVGGEVHGADVIAVDKGASRRRVWSSWSSCHSQVTSTTQLATAQYST
jgi:hypothetical protein